MNQEQLNRMTSGKGFIAALDQSGGSTPKALKAYGVDESAYSNDEEMFTRVHEMRTRIIKSPSFTKEQILAAILFENTMDRKIDDLYTADYLWEKKGVVPILKVDKGLAADKIVHFGPNSGHSLFSPDIFIFKLVNLDSGSNEFLLDLLTLDQLESQAIFLSSLSGLYNHLLHFRRQFLVDTLGNHHWLQLIGVMHFADILLYFIKFGCLEGNIPVALAVNNTLLQSGKGFRPGNRHRVGAPGAVAFKQNSALRDTELQIGHVSDFRDRMLGVRQIPVIGVCPSQDTESALLDGEIIHHLMRGSACSADNIKDVAVQVRQSQDTEFFNKRNCVGNTNNSHVQVTAADVLNHFSFVTKLAARKNLNFVLAIGALFNNLFETSGNRAHFRFKRVSNTDLEYLLCRDISDNTQTKKQAHCDKNNNFTKHKTSFQNRVKEFPFRHVIYQP